MIQLLCFTFSQAPTWAYLEFQVSLQLYRLSKCNSELNTSGALKDCTCAQVLANQPVDHMAT